MKNYKMSCITMNCEIIQSILKWLRTFSSTCIFHSSWCISKCPFPKVCVNFTPFPPIIGLFHNATFHHKVIVCSTKTGQMWLTAVLTWMSGEPITYLIVYLDWQRKKTFWNKIRWNYILSEYCAWDYFISVGGI